MSCDKMQQRHVASALYRSGKGALMARTCSCAAARQDFATLRDKALQALDIFIIDYANIIGTECTHLTAR
jgi:hypothetical protein